jgi:hypothetical protein
VGAKCLLFAEFAVGVKAFQMPLRSPPGAYTANFRVFAIENPEIRGKTSSYFSGFQRNFVTWRNNGIFSPINEFKGSYQSKSNGILTHCGNWQMSPS